MPTSTYTPLANITLGSSAASVTFSSISQAYRDLVLVMSLKSAATGPEIPVINFNGVTTTTYSYVTAQGNGTTTRSGSYSPDTGLWTSDSYNLVSLTDFDAMVINVMDYSATDKHKTALIRGGSTTAGNPGVTMTAGRWASTSAITSLAVNTAYSRGWAAGSTFSLFGVAA